MEKTDLAWYHGSNLQCAITYSLEDVYSPCTALLVIENSVPPGFRITERCRYIISIYLVMQGANLYEPVGSFGILKGDGEHHPKRAATGGGTVSQMAAAGGRVEHKTYVLALQKSHVTITLNT